MTAADIVESVVRRKPAAVLGLATGSTPLPAYQELIRRHEAGTGPSYDEVTCFNLDEYVGLPPGHEQSYRATIARELTDGLGISPDRVHGPDPDVDGLPARGALRSADRGRRRCRRAVPRHRLRRPPGLQRARVVAGQPHQDQDAHRADAQGQRALLRLADEVPTHVLTQGLGTILEARHLLLIATGEGKAAAAAAAVEGPVSASCPASVLQLHPHVTVLLDQAGAARLDRLDYYPEVLAAKPAWQGF